MPSNKKRLYIALYPSGVPHNEERKYHWAFLIGPKDESGADQMPGLRCHVKNNYQNQWVYEERKLDDVRSTQTLLARILIAKIEDVDRLLQIFRTTPIVQGNPNWRCRTWVAEVLRRLELDGRAVGTAVLDWRRIEPLAREYVRRKTAEGRFSSGFNPLAPRPTYDMLLGRETVP